ncbi:DUF2336 domain-containing protein [Kordiimonas sp.]|uniref:DUF2336 domain-containing protein n=1 Tax=Kordiimonas sp. TaxID=1970157 RepID=UPI003A900FD1
MEHLSSQHFILDPNLKSRAERAQALENAYADALSEALCYQLDGASPNRIHAKAIELKVTRKLTPTLMLAMVRRGAAVFTESAIALSTGRALLEIRDMLNGGDAQNLEATLHAASIDGTMLPAFMAAVQECYGNCASRAL